MFGYELWCSSDRPDDIALNAVLSNNIITLNKDQNIFDSKKRIKAATIQRLQQKLSSLQRRAISMNQCLLYMYMNQVSFSLQDQSSIFIVGLLIFRVRNVTVQLRHSRKAILSLTFPL
jgi:hypothetical protein